jgi:hypothetical protein
VILALQTPLTALAVWLLRKQRPAGFTAELFGALLVIAALVANNLFLRR